MYRHVPYSPKRTVSHLDLWEVLWQGITSLHVTGQILPSKVVIPRPCQCFASFLHPFRKTKFHQIISTQGSGLDGSFPSSALRIKQQDRLVQVFENTLYVSVIAHLNVLPCRSAVPLCRNVSYEVHNTYQGTPLWKISFGSICGF